ncbi:MAG: isocitrate/isopropylmalate family dehydrogenase, partial [Oligoflexia bacterium]|nr:isocitrate/isopropylmalate family dehydrogenase [Oligoflexia bacterium]
MSYKITVAYGDGIGPEIMEVVLQVLKKAGFEFQKDLIELGEKVYKQGHLSGVRSEDWEIIRKNKVFLKAPITTPQGGGFKSLNVKIRKSLGLFANIRPVRSLYPYVKTKFPNLDVVVIRENEED